MLENVVFEGLELKTLAKMNCAYPLGYWVALDITDKRYMNSFYCF